MAARWHAQFRPALLSGSVAQQWAACAKLAAHFAWQVSVAWCYPSVLVWRALARESVWSRARKWTRTLRRRAYGTTSAAHAPPRPTIHEPVIRGASREGDVSDIAEVTHLLMLRFGIQVWFEWVDSNSNPSDGLSRDGAICPLFGHLAQAAVEPPWVSMSELDFFLSQVVS